MPKSTRVITRADLISDEKYGDERRARRAAMLPIKKLRRIEIGAHATLYFESYDTMLQQVQEMLFVEKGGEEQIEDELTSYNPLIPQGDELVFTMMFEIDDPFRRLAILRRLGGIEEHVFLQVGSEKAYAVATQDDDVERTTEDGKTSAVHFMRFTLSKSQREAFAKPETQVILGMDHENYNHIALLQPASRTELAKDFG
ncbi:MAG: DUF3501 family protein [Maricaulaceae bacterium]